MMLKYLPPRDERRITISGYACPKLEVREINHGTQCEIVLDNRFAATIPSEHAESVLWLLANALAIGNGYSCHGQHSQPINPHRVRVACIGTVTDHDGQDHAVGEGDE